ncbi:hypothetical protein SynPROS91_02405 [Synechococcus sp. PROS-9-1]|nr:hypothetical protein SynPROS91_02405 [Synechococcus sp. PROS-9-1]
MNLGFNLSKGWSARKQSWQSKKEKSFHLEARVRAIVSQPSQLPLRQGRAFMKISG